MKKNSVFLFLYIVDITYKFYKIYM